MTKEFVKEIKNLLNQAKERVKTSINIAMVYTYYEIGKKIVEEEQSGNKRADYGKRLIKELSKELTKEFGKGYSINSLKLFRQFYVIYNINQIGQSVISQSSIKNPHNQIGESVIAQSKNLVFISRHFFLDNLKNTFPNILDNLPDTSDGNKFFLSWTHYVQLLKIKNHNERRFYEIECYQNKWSIRELSRQIDSSLYERLALSRNKKKIMELSLKGQIIEKPSDAIKEPLVLNFLGLKEDKTYTEKALERRIINKLQDFLMELGKGFTFVQRQMRITFDEQHFFADLVLYNRILRCFVIIDLKIGKLKHQDIGQMQMYVNYFDRSVKLPDENKTIGILLCKEKSDAIVKMTLPEDNDQIFATKYEMVLPSKDQLKRLLEDKDD